MKLEYIKPELEIEAFEVEDVITLSDPTTYDNAEDYGNIDWNNDGVLGD